MYNVPLDMTLTKLCSLDILKEKRKLYSLNVENREMQPLLDEIKKEYDTFHLPHAVFNILVDVNEKFAREKDIAQLMLFGSYAKLIYTDTSDIDIVVVFSDTIRNQHAVEKKLRKETEKIEKKRRKKIELHFFREKDMKRHDPLIKDIVRNGKLLW